LDVSIIYVQPLLYYITIKTFSRLSLQDDIAPEDDHIHSPSSPSLYAGQPLNFTQIMPTTADSSTTAVQKYWSQRYRLFSMYDKGICMDNGG